MAYDKVVDSKWLDDSLTLIAGEIRAKKSTQLGDYNKFPLDFQTAIRKIPNIYPDTAQTLISLESNMTTVPDSLFNNCKALKYVELLNVETIGNYGFNGCNVLEGFANTDIIKSIGAQAFYACFRLPGFSSKSLENLGRQAFDSCSSLEIVDLLNLKSTDTKNRPNQTADLVFQKCRKLKFIVIRSTDSNICKMTSTDFFKDCDLILSGSAVFVVPRDLIDTYRSEDNWCEFAHNSFIPLEEYTVDKSTTGDLNYNKLYNIENYIK